MLNGRYLATLSTFNGEICALVDSNQYDINDVTESSTSINLIDSSVSVSPINIANKKALKMAFYTADSDYGDDENFDLSSIGPRCVLNGSGTSLIVKTDKKRVYRICGLHTDFFFVRCYIIFCQYFFICFYA